MGPGVSLSARRVWIEIKDGNGRYEKTIKSLSARRVWIEIPPDDRFTKSELVTLREEGVD